MENFFRFSTFPISPEIIKAIEDMGFEEPTPIQAQAIPPILEGKDVTGQAQTGTGKTAAFGIPALHIVDLASRKTQVIVLSPTRELAIQTAEEFNRLAKYIKGMHILPVYGGQPIDRQFRALRVGVQIVVGTPGRVLDHLDRGTLSLKDVKMVVLDEADQMLDMGFRDDIEKILAETPKERQTVLFSATIPAPIKEISRRFQNNPEFVRVQHRELTVPQIEQLYLEVRNREKNEVLCRILEMYDPELALVFCNTKRAVDELTTQLQTRGYFSEALHGDMKQSQRDRVMAKFRKGAIDVLIATDVAARGIDVDDVDLVINFDVPQDVEYYVHRIGRTARAGREGRSITFVGPKEIYKLRSIQKYAHIKITAIPLPTARDVERTRMRNLVEKIKETSDDSENDKYVEIVEQIMVEGYTSLDIAAALLKMKLDTGNDTDDNSSIQADSFGQSGVVQLCMNLGREDRIRPKDIVGAITGETGITGKEIGAINIFDTYSLLEVPQEKAKQVVEGMIGKSIGGTKLVNGKALGYDCPKNENSRKRRY
ncbi:DEAD/DEAH box helicase [Methanogenium marinum]|uniref:RNA helicase n=1 Tax=Methanogenium marinum TaxID=348610 RepID=A0A9Q4KU79_9EURY|nr:DEAD/DEAH box helicase [Methanogenium marinum]MDE4908744.1 DEAD/DEAH box helicase [Methanogenium marinum]